MISMSFSNVWGAGARTARPDRSRNFHTPVFPYFY